MQAASGGPGLPRSKGDTYRRASHDTPCSLFVGHPGVGKHTSINLKCMRHEPIVGPNSATRTDGRAPDRKKKLPLRGTKNVLRNTPSCAYCAKPRFQGRMLRCRNSASGPTAHQVMNALCRYIYLFTTSLTAVCENGSIYRRGEFDVLTHDGVALRLPHECARCIPRAYVVSHVPGVISYRVVNHNTTVFSVILLVQVCVCSSH